MPRKKIRIADGTNREIEAARLAREIRNERRLYAKGESPVEDWEHDAKVTRLEAIDPTNRILLEVGAPVDQTLQTKVMLPLKMGSMNKTRPHETVGWLSKVLKTSTAIILTPKLDGIAGLLHYRNGVLIAAYKRGDGSEGVDVTALARHTTGVISSSTDIFGTKRKQAFYIPGDVFIKGEFIIHKTLFARKYQGKTVFKDQNKPYSNPRNFVAGVFNRTSVGRVMKSVLPDVCFIAYGMEVTSGPDQAKYASFTKLDELRMVEMLGFISVTFPAYPRPVEKTRKIAELYRTHYNSTDAAVRDHCMAEIETLYKADAHENARIATAVYNDHTQLTEQALINLLIANKQDIDLDQDGLVIDILDPDAIKRLGFEANGLNPAYARSIKLDRKDQDAQTGVCKHVSYRYTKRGLYKPRLVLETPLDFNGVKVTHATAHNWKFVNDNQLGPGAEVVIIRSGDVIPFILEVTKPSYAQRPMHCEFCNQRLARTDHDLYCYNTQCPGRQYAQLQNFVTAIETDDVSDSTVDLLFQQGFDSIPKLLHLTADDLQGVDRIGDIKAAMIPRNIQKALTNISLARLMYASSAFISETFSLGETRLSNLVSHLGADTVLSSSPGDFTVNELSKIRDVSTATAAIFIDGLPEFLKLYRAIKDKVSLRDFNSDGKLKGQRFSFTGYRDKNLKRIIEEHGGAVVGTVSSTHAATSVLFVKGGNSKKTEAAERLGVTIVPADKAEAFIRKRLA